MVFFPGLVEFMMAKELEYFIRCRTKDSDFVEFQAKFEEYEGPSCEKVKGIKILRSNERLGGICTVSWVMTKLWLNLILNLKLFSNQNGILKIVAGIL